MHRPWLISRTNSEFIRHISKTAGIPPLLATVLINRGIRSSEAARGFLDPSISRLSNPYSIPGMQSAVERIKSAIRRKERVFIHGDYDTDGLTATAILIAVLRRAGVETTFFIPNRMVHGYGFNRPSVDSAIKDGAKLIITVDCGISAFDAVSCARAAGIDVIITDHHEPVRGSGDGVLEPGDADGITREFILPEATAVVNPKLSSGRMNFSNLCGSAVAFRLAQALAMAETGLSEDDVLPLIDLAALGTVADVVPLTGDNRIIVKEGLRYINDAGRVGIKALRDVCGLADREIKAGLLSFTIVPRINAAGRVTDSSDVIRLLLTGSKEEATELSLWLDRINSERQQIEENVYQEALSQLSDADFGPVIVLSGQGWHQGVLGIVASRIAEQFYRPTFVLSLEDNLAKGSARSVPAFDLCAGLEECSGLLLSFGGHKQAAGLKLEAANVKAFEKMMGEFARERIGDSWTAQPVEIDAALRLNEVTLSLIRDLSLLEPYGFGNAEPLFGIKDLSVLDQRIVGRNHLRMKLRQDMQTSDAIGFDMGGLSGSFGNDDTVDIVFTPSINEWNDRKYIQLVIKAIRPAA